MIEQSPELRSIVERIIRAIMDRDGHTLSNLFLRADQLRYVGTDDTEWWSGPGVADNYPRHVDSWPPIHHDMLDIEAYASGNFGWAALRVMTKFSDSAEGIVRMTFVFVLEAGIWRVVQWHLSKGVPNLEWVGVELSGVLEDLAAEPSATGLTVRDGTITLLFTDIQDSTPMAAAMGDDAWLEAMKRHHQTIADIVSARGGTIVKVLGDGAMIVFDSTREALRAAVEIQGAEAATGTDLSIRIGVHVGDALASDKDYFGTAVNKAARIAAAADGGEIMISEAVRVLVADSSEFLLGEPRMLKLKGLDGIHQVTPLLWSKAG